MNRPTAIFFTVAHYLYQGDEDAVGLAYDLVRSTGLTGFGRERKWAALKKVAPSLASMLWEARNLGFDIIYVEAENPIKTYKRLKKEIEKAEAWFSTHNPLPPICIFLHTASTEKWPVQTRWQYAIWAIVNLYHLNTIDRVTGGIPLPRDTREALFRTQEQD